jgi:hypothetical protein
MKRSFHIPAGRRLVSAVPDLDWDRWLAEARTKKEAREALLAENEKHFQQEMTGESGTVP